MCNPALAAPIIGQTAAAAITPSLVAGVAMQGLGTLMQNNAAKRATNARNAALTRNTQRNRRLEDEAAASIGSSREEFNREENFDAGVASEASKLASQYNEATKPMAVNVGSKAGVPQIVQDTQNEELASAQAFNQQQNQALGELNSFGQYLKGTINPALGQSAADTMLMGNFMRGNSDVLQTELQSANDKAYSPMAQLLTGAGQTLTGYGLYSPTGPVGAAAAATAPKIVGG